MRRQARSWSRRHLMTFDPCQHGTLTEPHRPTAPHGRDAARMLAARPGRMHAPVAVVVGLAAHAEDLCGFRRADALAADAGCHLTSLPICPPRPVRTCADRRQCLLNLLGLLY